MMLKSSFVITVSLTVWFACVYAENAPTTAPVESTTGVNTTTTTTTLAPTTANTTNSETNGTTSDQTTTATTTTTTSSNQTTVVTVVTTGLTTQQPNVTTEGNVTSATTTQVSNITTSTDLTTATAGGSNITTSGGPWPSTQPTPCQTPQGFDTLSFFGGIILGVGILAIALFAYKFYVAKRGNGPYQQF